MDVRSHVGNEVRTGLVILTANVSQFDPNVWSGRALQEISSIWRTAVLHQRIRSLMELIVAPDGLRVVSKHLQLATEIMRPDGGL
jgi:hypothetical protein